MLSNFAVTTNGASVTATAQATLKNNFMSIVGVPTTVVGASSTVVKTGVNLEVALVLDNTNSMNNINPQTGNSAISDLKSSAAKFVDMVLPATQGQYYTKIALVPYGNAVKLGDPVLVTQIRGGTVPGMGTEVQGYTNILLTPYGGGSQISLPVSANCVTERQGSHAYDDSALGTNAGQAPVGYQYGPGGNNCIVVSMQPLTTFEPALHSTIVAMNAGGSTAGQVGITWGWYALSPTVGIWPAASTGASYDKLTTTDLTQRVRKVMVLMTDGEYNSAYCQGVISGPSSLPGSGSNSDHIGCSSTLGDTYVQANAMCAAVKQKGVEVFVITFQLDKSKAQRVALTQNCATDTSHLVDADTTSLDAAFETIANSINSMRITN